jgi:hypothetical protein
MGRVQLTRFVKIGALAAAVAGLFGSCAEIDNIESRTETINRGVADYYNESILLNILRASKSEPLAFVSVSSVTGHNTVTGNIGFPTITVGPHTPVISPAQVPARNYSFGPNTASRSVANDWTASVVDDAASYAGLLAPVNPAIIGFFLNQGYSRELLFFLFVDRIKIADIRSKTTDPVTEEKYYRVFEEYENKPVGADAFVDEEQKHASFQNINFECFQAYLAMMIREGFTAQVDVDALPAARSIPANRFCADPTLRVWFRQSIPAEVCKGLLSEKEVRGPFRTRPTLGMLRPICGSKTQWTIAKADTASGGSQSQASAAGPLTPTAAATVTGTGTAPVTLKVTNTTEPQGRQDKEAKLAKHDKQHKKDKWPAAVTTTVIGTASAAGAAPVTVSVAAPGPAPEKKPDPKLDMMDPCTGEAVGKVSDPRPGYELCLNHTLKVQVFLRSAFGVYQFLGKMFANGAIVKLYTDLIPDHDLLTIDTKQDDNYCFVSTSYAGEHYCVPTSAQNTKQIFALLRQLVGLNTTVQNQSATLTVRTTP